MRVENIKVYDKLTEDMKLDELVAIQIINYFDEIIAERMHYDYYHFGEN